MRRIANIKRFWGPLTVMISNVRSKISYFVSRVKRVGVSKVASRRLGIHVRAKNARVFGRDCCTLGNGIMVRRVKRVLHDRFSLRSPGKVSGGMISCCRTPLSVATIFSNGRSAIQEDFGTCCDHYHASMSPSSMLFLARRDAVHATRSEVRCLAFATRGNVSISVDVTCVSTKGRGCGAIDRRISTATNVLTISFSLSGVMHQSNVTMSSVACCSILLGGSNAMGSGIEFIGSSQRCEGIAGFVCQGTFNVPRAVTFAKLIRCSPRLRNSPMRLLREAIHASSGCVSDHAMGDNCLSAERCKGMLSLVAASSLRLCGARASARIIAASVSFSRGHANGRGVGISLAFHRTSHLRLTFRHANSGNVCKQVFSEAFSGAFR